MCSIKRKTRRAKSNREREGRKRTRCCKSQRAGGHVPSVCSASRTLLGVLQRVRACVRSGSRSGDECCEADSAFTCRGRRAWRAAMQSCSSHGSAWCRRCASTQERKNAAERSGVRCVCGERCRAGAEGWGGVCVCVGGGRVCQVGGCVVRGINDDVWVGVCWMDWPGGRDGQQG